MANDLESGQRIVDLFEKKIDGQMTFSIAFFGGSLLAILSFFTSEDRAIPLDYEPLLLVSFILYGFTVVSGYFAKLSLAACIPSMLNYEWGSADASQSTYDGKSVLETLVLIQFVSFLAALFFTGLFFMLNYRGFVA